MRIPAPIGTGIFFYQYLIKFQFLIYNFSRMYFVHLLFLALNLNLSKQRCTTLKPGNHENQTIYNRNADRTGFCYS